MELGRGARVAMERQRSGQRAERQMTHSRFVHKSQQQHNDCYASSPSSSDPSLRRHSRSRAPRRRSDAARAQECGDGCVHSRGIGPRRGARADPRVCAGARPTPLRGGVQAVETHPHHARRVHARAGRSLRSPGRFADGTDRGRVDRDSRGRARRRAPRRRRQVSRAPATPEPRRMRLGDAGRRPRRAPNESRGDPSVYARGRERRVSAQDFDRGISMRSARCASARPRR